MHARLAFSPSMQARHHPILGAGIIILLSLGGAASGRAEPFAYITNGGSGNVSVMDTATNTVAATVAGAGSNPYGVAVNALGTRVYVTNDVPAGAVSVIDTGSNTVVATVPVGSFPVGVASSCDLGRRVACCAPM